MRTNKPSCKYYKVCGSVDNCPGCAGYKKKGNRNTKAAERAFAEESLRVVIFGGSKTTPWKIIYLCLALIIKKKGRKYANRLICRHQLRYLWLRHIEVSINKIIEGQA